MDENQDRVVQDLIETGRKCLIEGDNESALAHFVTATQLDPANEDSWLLRAEATPEPYEAIQCLEHVLELNPENKQAKEKLVFYQLNTLQEGARDSDDVHPNFLTRYPRILSFGFSLLIIILLFCVVSAVLIGGYLFFSSSGTSNIANRVEYSTPSTIVLLPPTWTPPPTRTPLPPFTPVPRLSWQIVKEAIVRSGPAVNFDKIGTIPINTPVFIVARSKDNKFAQIEFPSSPTKFGWIPVESVSVDAESLNAIPTASNVLPSPTSPARSVSSNAPIASLPTNTPTPVFDFIPNRSPQISADCSRQTGLSGTVYNVNYQPLSGVSVQIWAFGQLQTTLVSGAKNGGGSWEWYFRNNSEVLGQVVVVSSDGNNRSQFVDFHLTACSGSNPANQYVIDFISTRR